MNFIPEKVADGDDLRTWVDFQWQMEMTGGGNYDKPSLAFRLPMKTRHPGFGRQQQQMSHLGYFWWRFLTDFRGSFVGVLELWRVFLSFPFGDFCPCFFPSGFTPARSFFLDKIWKLMLLWTELAVSPWIHLGHLLWRPRGRGQLKFVGF